MRDAVVVEAVRTPVARLATTLVHHMRSSGVRYGLPAMCEGGATANATILELP